MKKGKTSLPAALTRRVLTAVVCVMIGLGGIYAQSGGWSSTKRIQWGVKGGINFSQLSFEKSEGGSLESKSVVGALAGVSVAYAFNPKWRLHSGLEMSLKGFSAGITGSSSVLTVRAGYLQLPLEAGYSFTLGGWNLEPRLGLYLAYGVAGKYSVSETPVNKNTFGDQFLNRFDAGLRVGFYTNNDKIIVGLGGEIGTTEVNGKKFIVSGGTVSLQNFSISVGYLF
ncbi:porin family protein [Porphyromonas canoris]|uniref:porin family protein n=1 Tax=Porphyromonas canoris TaxID=36875 RepID=UPI00068EB1CC|nr:porin family protein [Porphyromonas canoris]